MILLRKEAAAPGIVNVVADVLSSQVGSRRVDTNRIALNVRESGTGPLMLFFHGITSNSAVFAPLMAQLSARFTTVAVDQRGHGLSDKPESGYEANDYADDIASLIRAFGQGPAILVGHSLGARNSVTAAARNPELVRSVIAIDFTPYIETEALDALESRVNAGDRIFRDVEAVQEYLAGRYPNIPADAIRIRAESGYRRVEGGLRPLASPSAMAQTAKGLRADLTQAYRDVAKPVLIVRGEESKLVSAAALAKTSRLRPDLPVVVVPGADHYVNEVCPEVTLKAITNFIDA
ncbi:alpha/beta fold hydrolase [Mesorhizobium sp. M2A.F.Ca.ET.037.01.1.1]|uniref:alpha/beta fold hydrolase n=3 Tax=Mesorhizobium TaxID=68287 RepID=UPI000F764A37|nr:MULTISPECIES: alpha/beta hydrolase [unclassified Mesorhizobium]RVC60856.1 alpha/beta fold hydrolase [Mesorhizobium sp. M00.F.Ca.ET.038.03.1.1]AZO37374.1 alpha/beta hydrolase [Mesorhizobium sp. M2A.F.Ca.ET.046.03.2.1]RUX20712.1 alpha/beta fold hydrolase [Mesorhizobium sp. M2A.F.Ca.ET.037.01.1.1]RWA91054.1 MAG: alpha/beta fold hydrolase [Mesorhizobium sp.]RWB46849.1 MAG: alpha/beta fold hydrolase [Mesorhizobium sp.]